MTTGARVSSIEALEGFRSSLVLYGARSRAVLEDVAQEIVRARIWLQTDRQVHWKRQIRLCRTAAAQAEQELMTARLSGDAGAIVERKKALAKARDALRQAEEGLERVRRWLQRYPTDIEARGALPRRLQHLLSGEMSRAVTFLETAATILTDYAGRGPGLGVVAAAPPAAPNPAGNNLGSTSTPSGPEPDGLSLPRPAGTRSPTQSAGEGRGEGAQRLMGSGAEPGPGGSS